MKVLYLLLFFSIQYSYLHAQKITISGYIKDNESGENLIGAAVIDKISGAGVVSNTYGFFSLSLNQGDSVNLFCTYVGYQAQNIQLIASEDKIIHFSLSGDTMLEEIEVVAEQYSEPIEQSTQMSAISIPVKQIKLLPALMGETDVLKALQLMPGVQSGSEGTSGLYVRGGGPDQNLILLDGVPVYNVSHLFGFFSIFNADALNRVELVKGGFPARYGGRLSSVIDISLKEGNMKEFHGEGNVGLISSKLTLEGPIIKDKASFMISGRRTYIDLLARPIIKNSSEDDVVVGYHFHDVNAKFNYKFSDKDRLYFSLYTGRDKAYAFYKYDDDYTPNYSEEEVGLRWGNVISALRWNHVFGKKLFSNVTATYSRYIFDIFTNYEDSYYDFEEIKTVTEIYKARYYSGIKDFAAKIDFDYYPSPNHVVRFGLNSIYHTFEPGAFNLNSSEISDINITQDTYGYEYTAYVEDDIKVNQNLNVNLGIHSSLFRVNQKNYYSVQPRVSARYLLPNKSSIKASYAQMTQFINLLTNSGIGLPTDLWVPSTENIKPQEAWQVALGGAKSFNNGFEMSIEAYYKEMKNLVAYKEGASFLEVDTDWETQVTSGNGESYGFEFLFQKKQGKTTGWIGYTLAWSNRQFDELNFGRKFPYKWDRRHDISIAIVHEWKPKIDLSVAWVYGTGNSITLPIGRYETLRTQTPLFVDRTLNSYYDYSEIDYYGERNGYRMRSYHRLDVNLAFKKQKKWGERIWSLGVYNLYSRKNPYYIDIGYDYKTDKQKFVQYSLFPIIP
ncbi:MAG: TonB-dependent receptor, partial [Thalassobius sp.]|nr:TonB-dependent receptor [Thalassovita sp.]